MRFSPEDSLNELYSRSGPWRVFVSSMMRGRALAAEREAVIDAADGFPLTRAWAWERDAQAGSYYSEEECIRTAGTSEVLVLILAEDITDITRAEYEAAHTAGAQVLAYLKTGVPRSRRLDALVRVLRDRGTTNDFADPRQLSTKVTSALRAWALRSGRSWMLAERSARQDSVVGEDDYRGVQFVSETAVPLAEVVHAARDAVADGRPDEALGSLSEIASNALDTGLIWLARRVLDDIDAILPSKDIDERWRGWLANLRGRELSAHRRHDDAVASFEQMRQIGRALGDGDLHSTALQNLSVEATLAGDAARAHRLIEESYALKLQIGDVRGSVQMLLNLVNVPFDLGELDAAEGLLDELVPVIQRMRDTMLSVTYHGHRGTLATRRADWPAAKASFQRSLAAARRAQSLPREIRALQSLGANANDAGNHRAATRWYRKGLALAQVLGDPSEEETHRRGLAVSLARAGEHGAAAEEFLAGAGLAEELGEIGPAARLRADAAASLLNAGRPDEAIGLLRAAIDDRHAAGDDDWRARQLGNLAAVHRALGGDRAAIDCFRQAANLADDPGLSARLLRDGALLALEHPDLAADGVDLLRRELSLHRQHEPADVWAWEAAVMGVLVGRTTRCADAAEFFAPALRVFARRDRRQSFFIRNDRAIAAVNCGDSVAAMNDLRACLRVAQDLDDSVLLEQAHFNLAEAQRRAGQLDRAEHHVDQAIHLAELSGDRASLAEGLLQKALIVRDQEDLDESERLNRQAFGIGRDLGDRQLQADAQGALAWLQYRAGRPGAAAQLYQRALRNHGDREARAVVEDIGGLVMSLAALGRFDEDLLERLLRMSGHLGWDHHASYELSTAAVLLDDKGDSDRANELMVHALAMAIRAEYRAPLTDEDDESQDDHPLVRSVVWFARWLCEGDDLELRLQQVTDGVERVADVEVAQAVKRMTRTAIGAIEARRH